ncbi:MAG: F0F1 ATP synthase subunit alpha, partial [Lapillicoccus sp.]
VRPAIDVGVSVSRVGGAAQIKAMKDVAGRLKLDLAQFRALEAFAMFASDLDPASRQQLAKGARLVELLKQRQSNPYPIEEQVVSIWAGTTGQLDSIKVEDVRRFETEFLDYLRRLDKSPLAGIRETKKFDDDTRAALESAVTEFKKQFGGETPLDDRKMDIGHEADPTSLEDSEIDQEQIVRQKR